MLCTHPVPINPRWRSAALAATTLVACVLMVPSLLMVLVTLDGANSESVFYDTPNGRIFLRTHNDAIALARNPQVRLLTDVGLLDLYQGERAAFGDPWLFCTMVELGRLQPTTMAQRIDAQYYDFFITSHDLDSPEYAKHIYRLPKGLFERVRANYVLSRGRRGLMFYVPRKRERGR